MSPRIFVAKCEAAWSRASRARIALRHVELLIAAASIWRPPC